MTRETFLCTVPFRGYYHTIHEQVLNDATDGLAEGPKGYVIERLAERIECGTDWDEVFRRYSTSYVQFLKETVDLASLAFESVLSPEFYNFETDRIFATVDRYDFARMLWAVRGNRLNLLIKERFTSCSGFISHYPNTLASWPRIAEWDHNHCGTVLSAYLAKIEQEREIKLEEKFADNLAESCAPDEWICDAANKNALRGIDAVNRLRSWWESKTTTLSPAAFQ